MQADFFQKQMDRLRKVYSSTSLNEERVKVLWDRFANVNGDQFEKAVNHLIGEYTTQALPALSRFVEAVAFFRPGEGASNMQISQPAHFCEPCRDFGFVFEGDVVVRCENCPNGKSIGPARLLHHQQSYDRGRKLFARGRIPVFGKVLPDLPYDQSKRIDRSGEWR